MELKKAKEIEFTSRARQVMKEQCPSICRSFKIKIRFAIPRKKVYGSLGFSKSTQRSRNDQDPRIEVRSTTVNVLVDGRISKPSQEALTRILKFELENAFSASTRVRMTALANLAGLSEDQLVPKPQPKKKEEKNSLAAVEEESVWSPILRWVNANFSHLVWPICFLMSGFFMVFILTLSFRHRRSLEKMAIAAKESELNRKYEEHEKQEAQKVKKTEDRISAEYRTLFAERIQEISWLLNEYVEKDSSDLLGKLLAIFSANEISSRVELSSKLLQKLAKVTPSSENSNNVETCRWLKREIDRAHWEGLSEKAQPLRKINQLSEEELSDMLTRLVDPVSRAVVLSALAEEKWPKILSEIPAKDRVNLVQGLVGYRAMSETQASKLETKVWKEISQERDSGADSGTEWVARLSSFLDEKENALIQNSIQDSIQNSTRNPISQAKRAEQIVFSPQVSIDEISKNMAPSHLAETCMEIGFENLNALLQSVSKETQGKILSNLPSGLKGRLIARQKKRDAGSSASDKSIQAVQAGEMKLMAARAKFRASYKKRKGVG